MPATTENKTADLNTAKGLPSSDENNFEKRKKAAEEGYTFILSKEVSLSALDKYNDENEIQTMKDLARTDNETNHFHNFLFCYSDEAMDLVRPLPFLEFFGGYDALVIDLDKCLWNSMSDAETILFNKLFKESKKPVYIYFSSDSYPTVPFVKGLSEIGLKGIIIKDNGNEEKIENIKKEVQVKILIEKGNIIQ